MWTAQTAEVVVIHLQTISGASRLHSRDTHHPSLSRAVFGLGTTGFRAGQPVEFRATGDQERRGMRAQSRLWATAAAATLCWAGLTAATASAASETTNCAGLKAALAQARNGDTITLDQLCTKSNSGMADGAFTLPTGVSFTLLGKTGSGAGFDGTGTGQSILQETTTGPHDANSTVRNLTFKNGTATASTFGGAIYIDSNYNLSLDHDTFTGNAAPIAGGAVELATQAGSGSISITNSTFHGNTAAAFGGALDIEGNPHVAVTLSNNTFSSNTVTGYPADLLGGAVNISNASTGTSGLESLTQTGNTFSGNSITGGPADANGGGEALLGLTLHSTDDVFTGNSLRAAPSGHFSEGSGLSVENNSCNTTLTPHHVATNLVVAGNSIASGGAAGSAHGALYVGCGEAQLTGNNLTLNNATISGNSGGGGGTAGIFGDSIDNLTLHNSIVAGDTGGAELTGFNGTGGSIAVRYTDLCHGTAPFTGTGNICATPRLVNSATGNVRELSSSPTIDKGSNALVPGGVTKDVYGKPRIAAKLQGHTAIVDMGAAEFPTIRAPKVSIHSPANHATFRLHQKVHSSFTCTEGAGGPGIASCRDGSGRSSGALINTSTAGKHTFKVIATSRDGLRTTKTVRYTVGRRRRASAYTQRSTPRRSTVLSAIAATPLRLRSSRAISSAGRAPSRQGGGHWFEPSIAHCLNTGDSGPRGGW
jgi:hypothetical protein